MNLQAFINDVRTQTAQLASFGHTLDFDLDNMGVILIDATNNHSVASDDGLDADCTITFSERAIEEVVIAQTMSLVQAVTLGEITVEGAKDVGERFLTLMPEEDDWDERGLAFSLARLPLCVVSPNR